ncbi:MAG: alpha/beta hydrolase-fold protein [Bacteroidia bacterium]
MKTRTLIIIFLLFPMALCARETYSTTFRDTIHSEILGEDRPISVHVPASAFTSKQKYPVLFILDGDYNFTYVKGLLDVQATIGERIPEMILVGISGKGSETYRRNCKPDIPGVEDSGNADQFADFIEKELFPFIHQRYPAAGYNILAGHSIGGLCVVNTALNRPNLFQHYIAISPALWWEQNAINQVAEAKAGRTFEGELYVSLADEEGMGVQRFLKVATGRFAANGYVISGILLFAVLMAFFLFFGVKKRLLAVVVLLTGLGLAGWLHWAYTPSSHRIHFKQFPLENHNTVGLPTYLWALQDIFHSWNVRGDYFESAEALENYFEQVYLKYGKTFNLPHTKLYYTGWFLQDNPDEIANFSAVLKEKFPASAAEFDVIWANRLLKKGQAEEATALLKQLLQSSPNHADAYKSLAGIYLDEGKPALAGSMITTAIELAEAQKQRNWQLNELYEVREKVQKMPAE